MMLGVYTLRSFIKTNYLLSNGKRVLCEIVEIKFSWNAAAVILCRVPGESKMYKGVYDYTFKRTIIENNIRYIPIYLSSKNEDSYLFHYDEIMKLCR